MKDRAKIEAAADKLVKRGKLTDAILEYRKLLTGEEQDIPILTIIGDLYIKSSQTDKAVGEFRKIAAFYENKGLYSKSIAILKRINRLAPDDLETTRKLADLHHDQGFSSEARTGYLKLANALVQQKRPKDAIPVFVKLLKLSPEDHSSREKLSDLYQANGEVEKAVDELNIVAENHIRRKALDDARKMLDKARKLLPDSPKTLTNLIDLLRLENKKQDALDLIGEILKKDKENLKALYLLGNFHFEEGHTKEAVEIFSKIVAIRPKEVEALVKLGRIHLQGDDLDKAYELFSPLADTLLRKQKEDKAIGLMGLILQKGKMHLPTLEKLGEIYLEKGLKENFAILGRVVLKQYEKQDLKDKRLRLLGDLVDFFPENEEFYYDYRRLKEEMGVGDDDLGVEQVAIKVDEAKEIIDSTLAKSDLYLEQGLIRNAQRILENLRMRFPDEPKIRAYLEKIKSLPKKSTSEDLAHRVGEVAKKESRFIGEIPDSSRKIPGPVFQDSSADERLSAADIFAETDIIPMVSADGDKKRYFDLAARIGEEMEAIKAVHNYQIRGDTTIVEKALTDIVTDFRKALEEKVDKEDFDSHYNLGIAFLEQGLYDEAIEEGKLAAAGKKQAVDSYSLISLCFRHKQDYEEARKWLNKALKQVENGSEQAYALQYEMGALHEQMKDSTNALKFYKGVHQWNSEYRDVAVKLKELKK